MSVQSIERAFSVLRALALGPIGVTELAERVDLPKSTVARLLSALESEGAVEQVEAAGDYRLGAGLIDIAGGAQPGRNLIAAARPHLLELAEATDEVAGLSIIDDMQVYYLDQTESESNIQVRDWTGDYAPLHAVPSGLVMLARLPAGQRSRYIDGPLETTTSKTITDPKRIRDRLAEIKETGYAWVFEEFAEGINSVAAPIIELDGHVEAALHVHGPAYRFPGKADREEHGTRVAEAATRLAEQLTD